MSKIWYLSADGSAQEGPITSKEVMARLEEKSEGSASFVWRAGLDNWREIRSVSEFVSLDMNAPFGFPKTMSTEGGFRHDSKEDIIPSQIGRHNLTTPESTMSSSALVNHHPWRRFFARTVDLLIWSTAASFLIGLLLAMFTPQLVNRFVALTSNMYIAGIVFYFLWIPVEATLLTLFGTTFGKWCFGISVEQQDRGNLDFGTALNRTCLVWLKGDGLGLPLVTLITRIVAYNKLTSTGITSWDEECKTDVLHKKWGIVRAVMCTVLIVVLVVSMAILNAAIETPTLN